MTSTSPLQLVDVNRLQSGDILLSRPREAESCIIAALGRSRFSHAELVVGEPVGGQLILTVYEATTALTTTGEIVGLVRQKRLADYLYVKASSGDTRLLRPVLVIDISECAKFEVLRWRGPITEEFKQFQHELAGRCRPLRLTPYSDINALARLTAFPWLVKALAWVTRRIPYHVSSGLFCSQLVAKLYKEGKFTLSPLAPEDITPRHIAKLAEGPDSPLKIVPRETLLFSPGNDYVVNQDWRQENIALNQHSTNVAMIIRTSETISEKAYDMTIRGLNKISRMFRS